MHLDVIQSGKFLNASLPPFKTSAFGSKIRVNFDVNTQPKQLEEPSNIQTITICDSSEPSVIPIDPPPLS